jgi:hypothetical protein
MLLSGTYKLAQIGVESLKPLLEMAFDPTFQDKSEGQTHRKVRMHVQRKGHPGRAFIDPLESYHIIYLIDSVCFSPRYGVWQSFEAVRNLKRISAVAVYDAPVSTAGLGNSMLDLCRILDRLPFVAV